MCCLRSTKRLSAHSHKTGAPGDCRLTFALAACTIMLCRWGLELAEKLGLQSLVQRFNAADLYQQRKPEAGLRQARARVAAEHAKHVWGPAAQASAASKQHGA